MSNSEKSDAKALALFEQSLDQPSQQRADWIRAAAGSDEKLCEKALSYLSHDKSAGFAFQTGGALQETLDDVGMPEQIGAYKVVGLIGRGGMGAVYRCQRASGDFDHDVAIKVIRPGVLSDQLIARFQNERQTLARLSHPNIARLFDGGTLENGAPFIVMEYIDGLPITDWADKNNASTEQRFDLFKSVCAAVGHAHQNLIIHRDISPSNVLVDKAGQVKLIDFGIAKSTEEAPAPASKGNSLPSLSFTPGFAAPERSKGNGANTLSDIYSLGKLLAALMGSTDTGADLQAIINKAAATAPEDRYLSVSSLVDDVENCQRGFPVDAVPRSGAYWLGKFVSRHKAGALLTGVALAGLIAAFTTTLIQYQRAEAARVEADKRFSETRELTSFLLNDLGEDLSKLPGTLVLTKKVSDTSSKYLEILSRASVSDPEIKLDYAKGLAQLGDILTQAGGQNLGDPEQGIEHFEDSIKVLTELAASGSPSDEVMQMLAETHMIRAYAHRFYYGSWEETAKAIDVARPIFQRLLENDPSNMELKTALLDLRFEEWMYGNSLTAPEDITLDADILSLKKDVEKTFEGDLANDDYIISYGAFLYLMAASINEKWNGDEIKPIPVSEREEYETLLGFMEIGFEYMHQNLLDNPTNPEDIYAFFWALEVYVNGYTRLVEWRPNIASLAELAGQRGEPLTREILAQEVQKNPDFRFGLDRAKTIETYLETADELLERLKPFDDNTYSYLQVVYSTYSNRYGLNLALKFNLDAAEEFLLSALSVPEGYLQIAPENERVRLEVVSLKIELAYLLLNRGEIFGENEADRICTTLDAAAELNQFGEDTDVAADWILSHQTRIVDLKSRARCN
ncbi:MAG: serine/threonine protein kinase [Hyphococcus sp.]|nr:MAG: serine/threonine protein kinase [Marinicaulis sp.]